MSKPLAWLGVGALVVGTLFIGRSLVTSGHGQEPTERADDTETLDAKPTHTAPSSKPSAPVATQAAGQDAKPPTPRPSGSGAESPASADEHDPLFEVRRAADDHSTEGTDKLVASLTSTDPIIVTEATKELIARKATTAIGPLTKVDLSASAGGGLSIIDALGRLGGLAGGRDKSAAVDRLIALLAEQKKPGAADSTANLLQIYEALGETHDPRAAGPLEAELLDPNVARAPKVVIVQALVAIGRTESRGPLTQARAQQTEAVAGDALEEEIRVELVAAIDKALSELP